MQKLHTWTLYYVAWEKLHCLVTLKKPTTKVAYNSRLAQKLESELQYKDGLYYMLIFTAVGSQPQCSEGNQSSSWKLYRILIIKDSYVSEMLDTETSYYCLYGDYIHSFIHLIFHRSHREYIPMWMWNLS
jgi:hypothetical protein